MKKTIVGQNGIIYSSRKIILIGDSLGITLPAEWVRQHGLQSGDKVSLMANSILSLVKLEDKRQYA